MALDFPSSPVLNQVFTSGNRSWIWNGTEWIGNTPIINYTANRVLLGNGTSLFQEVAPGTAGNLLTSNGTTWTSATAPAGGITNIVTATGNTTLTSTPTILRITPTNYGTTVKLPDATTMTVGTGKFSVQNLSPFDVRLANTSGTLLGFVPGYGTVEVDLVSNSTADGTWSLLGRTRLGISGQRTTNTLSTGFSNISSINVIELDSDRVFYLLQNASNHILGQVFDQSTNTFGSEVLIRAASVAATSAVQRIDANSVIVVSTSTIGASFQAVVLSISGTTITVNTAASYGLPSSNDGLRCFEAIPSGGFIYGYYTSSDTTIRLVGVSASGTTASIGTAVSTAFTSFSPVTVGVVVALDKLIMLHPQDPGGLGGFQAFSLSGTTITAGTRVSGGVSTNSMGSFMKLTDTTFFFAINSDSSASGYAGVISLSGLVVTVYISANVASETGSRCRDAIMISSTKVLFSYTGSAQIYLNTLTFTGSAVTLGTAITAAPAAEATTFVDMIGNTVYARGGSSNPPILALDVSAASPTILSYYPVPNAGIPPGGSYGYRTNQRYGLRANNLRLGSIQGGATNQTAWSDGRGLFLNYVGNQEITNIQLDSGNFRRPTTNERFMIAFYSNTTGSKSVVQKIEIV